MPEPHQFVGQRGYSATPLGRTGCSRALDQIRVAHELEVVTAEPSPANLLDERQRTLPTPLVYGHDTDAEQVRGLHTGQPVMFGVGWLGPALVRPRRPLGRRSRSSRLTRNSSTLVAVQRRSTIATSGGKFAFRDKLPTSDTWQPRISAACAG